MENLNNYRAFIEKHLTWGNVIISLSALLFMFLLYMIISDMAKWKSERLHFESTLKVGQIVDTWHNGVRVTTRITALRGDSMILTKHGLMHIKQIMKRG